MLVLLKGAVRHKHWVKSLLLLSLTINLISSTKGYAPWYFHLCLLSLFQAKEKFKMDLNESTGFLNVELLKKLRALEEQAQQQVNEPSHNSSHLVFIKRLPVFLLSPKLTSVDSSLTSEIALLKASLEVHREVHIHRFCEQIQCSFVFLCSPLIQCCDLVFLYMCIYTLVWIVTHYAALVNSYEFLLYRLLQVKFQL